MSAPNFIEGETFSAGDSTKIPIGGAQPVPHNWRETFNQSEKLDALQQHFAAARMPRHQLGGKVLRTSKFAPQEE